MDKCVVVPAGKFFWFLLYMTQTLLYFTYYGVMCVAVTPNLLMAAVAGNSLYLTMNLFSGFVIPAPVSFFFTPAVRLPVTGYDNGFCTLDLRAGAGCKSSAC